MPVKYILPNKKSYPFSDICATLFVKSVIFFSASICFILFEVNFLFNFFSLPAKSVFFTNESILFSYAKFACANLEGTFSAVNVLNSCIAIYLLL